MTLKNFIDLFLDGDDDKVYIDVHIKAVDNDVILHNISFARFDERNRYFVFIGRTAEETIMLPQERVISLEFGKEKSND